ncbi:MAG: putative response regulator [Myxococcales bacterium]|nr:putative response regulator [Myxococcales bacterium]
MFTALVIEHDPSHSECVREALSDAGCLDIESVSSDHEAETLATEGGRVPDLVIVDVSGLELRPLQRLAKRFRDVPILAVCSELAMDSAFAAGAVDCMTKPVRTGELRSRIREALRLRSDAIRRANRERKLSDAIVTLQKEKQDLERLVCVDPLTGIANRRHTFALLEAEWKRSARERLPLAVLMIDLDCYHSYNEQYGHLGGDACLQRVTEAMVTCLRRPSDFLGRYGGEEFIAVLPNTDAVGAKIVAERLRAAVEALGIPHEASKCSRVVTITAGFASLRVLDDVSLDKLVAAADAALLHAKANGRNRIHGVAPLVRPTRMSAQLWQRFAPVFADPWFADRIPVFLAEVRDDARGISETLRAGEFESIGTTARDLKSSAAEFGFLVIARLAGELEQAAQQEQAVAARAAADQLLQYVTHVQVVYRRPIEASIVNPVLPCAPGT